MSVNTAASVLGLILILTLPIMADATHLPGDTNTQRALQMSDRRLAAGGSTCATRGTMSAATPFTAGGDYIIVSQMAGNDAWTHNLRSPTNVNLVTVNRNATLSDIGAGATAHLLYFQNWTSNVTPFLPLHFFAYSINTPETGTHSITCTAGTGQACGDSIFNPTTTASITNYVGLFAYATCGATYPDRAIAVIISGAASLPTAPVLSGTVTGYTSFLSWTTASGTISGYNLSRTDPFGVTTVIPLGLVNSYTDDARTRNTTYNVTAWNPTGNGTPSNNISLRQTPRDLFGDDGALYGPGKQALADAAGVSTTSFDILYGLLFVLIFAALGYSIIRLPGALGGAALGLFFAIAGGMFPIWVLFFLAVVATAAFLLYRQRTSAGGD